MKNKTIILIALIIVAILTMNYSGKHLTSQRIATTGTHSATPWVRYVTVGLGGFRGVISEILWLRASNLQSQGRYTELVQLTDWINSLDPNAADAWDYNAWNLAYNIPAMLPDDESKLQWVNEGISLLRDKAIPANPSTPSLYRNLSWMYQNKLGDKLDSSHEYYKLALAKETTSFLQGKPVAGALDLAIMKEIEERYGPIDWRLSNAHGLYWAWRGLKLNPTGFEKEALTRALRQNLVMMIYNGKFTGSLEKNIWRTAPNYDLIPKIMADFEEASVDNASERRIYCIFLNNITQILKRAGEKELAALTAKRLNELLPTLPDGTY